MGQQQSFLKVSHQTGRSYPLHNKGEQFYNKRIEHEGMLKLRGVPFKNCIQIQVQNGSLFLQNIEITLKDLLQSRLYTNKLFPKQDIQRLIENVTYTLAYLQQNQVPYKNLCSQNIYYDDGIFKLLPNELIWQSRYKSFLNKQRHNHHHQSNSKNQNNTNSYNNNSQINNNKSSTNNNPNNNNNTNYTNYDDIQYITLSPEMIIAYRCKQTVINELDILDKSNVFYLGLLLMEVTTLLPSFQCYDTETSDILDEVVNQRIQLIKEYYNESIAVIVANMLDYDYVERMNLKEVSIFVNRQLNRDLIGNSKLNKQLSNKKGNRAGDEGDNQCSQYSQNSQNNQYSQHSQHNQHTQSTQNSQFTQLDQHITLKTIQILQPQQIQSKVNNSKSISICKSRLSQSQQDQQQSRLSKPSQNGTISQKKKNKTNKIYMNPTNGASFQQLQSQQEQESTFARQDRNKVYMKSSTQHKKFLIFNENNNSSIPQRIQRQRKTTVLRQVNQNTQGINSSTRLRQTSGKLFNINNARQTRQKFTPAIPQYSIKSRSNINNQEDEQNRFPTYCADNQSFKRQLRRKNSTDYLGYRANVVKTPKQQTYHQQQPRFSKNDDYQADQFKQTHSYSYAKQQPDFGYSKNQTAFDDRFAERQSLNDSGSKGYFKAGKHPYNHQKISVNNQTKDHDHSLSRIKSEIQRSRKLIEQFKRSENCQY